MLAKGRTPSQRDIARVAGVSQAAVSMVVNGKADQYHLAQATQDRVREAMRELGYVPSVAGRSLRGGRNGLLGVHTYESVFPVAADDYYHEFLVGIEQAAVRARQDLILFASTESADGTRSIYTRSGNRLHLADGAVILGHEQSNTEIEQLSREGYPFVYVGRRDISGVQMSYVTADYAAGVRAVVDALADAGHERVAYLASSGTFTPLVERRTAFAAHAAERGLVGTTCELGAPDDPDAPDLARLRADGVTAVVAETPEIGRAVATEVERHGVRVPADLSVVTLDRGNGEPAFSSLDVPRRAMGARAVELLLELLDDPAGRPRRDVLACGWLDTSSIAPPAPARLGAQGPNTR